jgi:general secretion pathway protein G
MSLDCDGTGLAVACLMTQFALTPSSVPRLDRRPVRGVTLVEMLIVVAIIAMISSGIGFAVFKHWQDARIKATATGARQIRGAVRAWWLEHGEERCPSFADLLEAKTLDRDSPRLDAWGSDWRVECQDDDVTVSSAGPDRKPDTVDDIRVPPV